MNYSYTCFTCTNTFTTKHKPANLNTPFCSHSCSAKTSNKSIKRKKEIKYCLFCNKILNKGTKYCSSECSARDRTEQFIRSWLEGNKSWSVSSQVPAWARKHLSREQGGVCAICGIEPMWQGLPLVFIADHINGDSSNNHRDNLRLICPNCDSQLDTYKAKNKGNGREHRRRMKALY